MKAHLQNLPAITFLLLTLMFGVMLQGMDAGDTSGQNTQIIVPREWGTVAGGFRLAAALRKTHFETNELILLSLILENADSKPHWLMDSGSLSDYDFILKDGHGTRLLAKPRTNAVGPGYVDSSAWNPATTRIDIQPGKQIKIESDLRFIFEIRDPGAYRLVVRRSVPSVSGPSHPLSSTQFTNTISNTLEFSIVNPAANR